MRGTVRTTEGDSVPYTLVRLEPGYAERFSDVGGSFLFAGVSPGRHRLIARQVGFTPFDTVIDVVAGMPRLQIGLRRLALTLTELTVRGSRECERPGAVTGSSGLVALFEQLRQNAERATVLAEQYPYRYSIERRITERLPRRATRVMVDTTELSGAARWPYAPGRVVTEDGESATGGRLVHLPVLTDFADSLFRATHCFELAGSDNFLGDSGLVRLDFRVARSIRTPDVNGSAWLDPVTFQIRHTRVELTRVDRAARGVREWRATVTFREIAPNVVVQAFVEALTVFETTSRGGSGRTEEQRLLGVDFLRPLPSQEPRNGN